jgi:protein-histidine pros-kinase
MKAVATSLGARRRPGDRLTATPRIDRIVPGGIMDLPGIRALIRRILLSVFIPAVIAGAGGFYLLLQERGARTAEEQARILLATAVSVRKYTTEHILPELSQLPTDRFREETVTSFAAQTVFRGTAGNGYAYHETALNPTNPADRPDGFEVDLLRRFRQDPALTEISGTMDSERERVFYVAHPIRIGDPACLTCHDTPERAPPAMLAKYGTVNGFGWKLNDTVGIQVLTIPVTTQLASTLAVVGFLCAGAVLVFGAAYFALTRAMDAAVVQPLQTLAEAANDASRHGAGPALPRSGTSELRGLAEAIERLRISLGKALARLAAQQK